LLEGGELFILKHSFDVDPEGDFFDCFFSGHSFDVEPEGDFFDCSFSGHSCGHPLTYFFFIEFHGFLQCLDDACKYQAGFYCVCTARLTISLVLIRFDFCGIVTVFVGTDAFAVIHDYGILKKSFERYVFDLA